MNKKLDIIAGLLLFGIIVFGGITVYFTDSVNALYCDEKKLVELKTEVNSLTNIINEKKEIINQLKNSGNAKASEVLSGKKGYAKGKLITGSMTNINGLVDGNKATIDANYFKMNIKINGYYDSSDYLAISYSELANMIGLDASKIKKGVTILGVTGTY